MTLLPLLLIAFQATPASAESKPYLPSSAPVSLKPLGDNDQLFNIGLSRIAVSLDWRDNFFGRQEELVGQRQVTASGLSVGWVHGRGGRYTDEWDIIAGRLEGRAKTRRYFSTAIGKDVDVGTSGQGFELGARYLGGWTLAKNDLSDSVSIDWTLAGSLHAMGFTLNNDFTARSADGLDVNHYKNRESGLLLRPSVAFQPILNLGSWATLSPYAGTSALFLGGLASYEDTVFVRGGVPGKLTSSDDAFAAGRGFELMYGFDIGITPPFARKHRVMLGGAAAKLLGSSGGDFSEFHVSYAIPFDPRSSATR